MNPPAPTLLATSEAVSPRVARHPMGVIAVVLGFVSAAFSLFAVISVGNAASQAHLLYGRHLFDIPAEQLPPSVTVYLIVLTIGIIGWLISVVLGALALLRHGCKLCGTLALALGVITPVACFIALQLTVSGSVA